MMIFKNEKVTVFQSALVQTNTTVVETKDLVLVVDPNWLPQEVDGIASYVRKIKNGRPVYLLFTHSDFDHVLGYGAFHGAETIASLGVEEHPGKEKILGKIKAFDDEFYITRPYLLQYPAINHVIHMEGQQFTIGDTVFTFYKSPGHREDSLFTVIDSVGVWIGGDYLSDVEFPFIEDSQDYQKTLGKVDPILERHAVKLFIPGHGQPTEDLKELRKRQQNDLRYIRMLRDSLFNNNEAELKRHMRQYEFYEGLKSSHDENIEVVKKESEID